jgi:hypothetical protein
MPAINPTFANNQYPNSGAGAYDDKGVSPWMLVPGIIAIGQAKGHPFHL